MAIIFPYIYYLESQIEFLMHTNIIKVLIRRYKDPPAEAVVIIKERLN